MTNDLKNWITRLFKKKRKGIIIERRLLMLDRTLFNEFAKPPYAHLLAMTDLGNMIFYALEKAGCQPLFRADIKEIPIPFLGIEINVPIDQSKHSETDDNPPHIPTKAQLE